MHILLTQPTYTDIHSHIHPYSPIYSNKHSYTLIYTDIHPHIPVAVVVRLLHAGIVGMVQLQVMQGKRHQHHWVRLCPT